MKVYIKDEEELQKVCKEALHILNNLRDSTRAWERDYGSVLKNKKKTWEERADKFLAKLQSAKTFKPDEIKIETNDDYIETSPNGDSRVDG